MKELIINFILWLIEVALGVVVILLIWWVISYLFSLFLSHFNLKELQIEIILLLSIGCQATWLSVILYKIFYK